MIKIKMINKNNPNKIIFFGTPQFGANILNYLNQNFNVVAVVTAPDKKIHSNIKQSSVKKIALKENIQILQPNKIKNNLEFEDTIKNIKPDFFVVASYGLIIPKKILEIPNIAPLNIHPSLLPKYRGACPIRSAIKNGDKETGVTIIKIDEKLDHGPIVMQQKCKILDDDSYKKLKEKLTSLSKELIVKAIDQYSKNQINLKSQDHNKATYTRKISKQDGKINWNQSTQIIKSLIQAYCQKPGTYTKITLDNNKLNGKKLKIFNLKEIKKQGFPGKIFITKNKEIAVYCKKNALILKKVQLPGKNIVSSKDLYNGYNEIKNAKLG